MRHLHRIMQQAIPLVPRALRRWVRSHISLQEYNLAQRREENPFRGEPSVLFPDSPYQLGIIEDVSQYHRHYVAACRELSLSYEVLDILADDWVEQFRSSSCDAFLVWPSCSSTVWKEAFDYRLRILARDLHKIVYPTWQESWLTEHKCRLRDWLYAHGIPRPKTWVYHYREQALKFCDGAELPVVIKTATGGSASGVYVVRTRAELKRIVKKAFRRGLVPRGFDPADRQWGFVYIQEYLPNVIEWRMVRIGDSFFGYRKEAGPSGIHSASKKWSWLDPGQALLDLTRQVTDAGGFTSMDVDVFQTEDGRLLVNECQTVFGCTTPDVQMKIDGVPGRYRMSEDGWVFEEGNFCRNHMCNLRIEYLLSHLDWKNDQIDKSKQ